MKGSSVFISYRREDSEDITGRIHDHLERLIDRKSLFRDVDNIPPGVRFDTHLNDALQNCGLVLAIIGPDWVTPRLSEPLDHLRLEIEYALRREIPIIPVLVRDADIPTALEIPESIANLVLYNAAVVHSGGGFKSSVESLAEAIKLHTSKPQTVAAPKKLNLSPLWHELNKATRVEDFQKLANKLKASEQKYPGNEEIRDLKQQVDEALSQESAKNQAEKERQETEQQTPAEIPKSPAPAIVRPTSEKPTIATQSVKPNRTKWWVSAVVVLLLAVGVFYGYMANQTKKELEGYLYSATTLLEESDYNGAQAKLAEARKIDPDHSRLVSLESRLAEAKRKAAADKVVKEKAAKAAADKAAKEKAAKAAADKAAKEKAAKAAADKAAKAAADKAAKEKAAKAAKAAAELAKLKPEMVVVPAGHFKMGSTVATDGNERNGEESHWLSAVGVGRFAMSVYEVTNAEYRRFEPTHDSGSYKGKSLNGDDQPVVNVSWHDATEYAEWLSKQTGERYRLPTEAEWEYAARAGTTTRRYWGDDTGHIQACNYANVHDATSKRLSKQFPWAEHNCDDGFQVSAPVHRSTATDANAFGLRDMLGNAGEWTCSVYKIVYGRTEQACAGSIQGLRVVRGGSWAGGPPSVRSANRRWVDSVDHDVHIGFRLARTL